MKILNQSLLNAIQLYGAEEREHIFYLQASTRRGQVHTRQGRLTHAHYEGKTGMAAVMAMFEDAELVLSMDCIEGQRGRVTMDACIEDVVLEVVAASIDATRAKEKTQVIPSDGEDEFDFHNLEPTLEFIGDAADGTRVPLTLGRNLLGRSKECDIRIPCDDISRKHCEVVVTHSGIRLDDLGSVNGTFVNGSHVLSSRLASGDVIQIGPARCRLVFRVRRPGVNYSNVPPTSTTKIPPVAKQTISFRDLKELQARYQEEKEKPTFRKLLTSLVPGPRAGSIFVESPSDRF